MFCFICSKQCIKIISSRKESCFFISVFKKIIPNNITPTFQEVGGVTQPPRWHKNFSWYVLTVTKLIDFYSRSIYTFLFATVFNWNEPKRQVIAKSILPHGKI